MGRVKVHLVQVKDVNKPVCSSEICPCSPPEQWRGLVKVLQCDAHMHLLPVGPGVSALASETANEQQREYCFPGGHRSVRFGVRRTGPPISVCTHSVHRGWWPACEKSPSHPEPSPSPGRTGRPGAPGGSPISANAGGKTQESFTVKKPSAWSLFYFKAIIWTSSEGDRQSTRAPQVKVSLQPATDRWSHHTVIWSAFHSCTHTQTHTYSSVHLLNVKTSVGSLKVN